MQVSSFDTLRRSFEIHSQYWVAGFMTEPLLEQRSVYDLARHFHLKRKSLQTLLLMQSTGKTFQFGRRGKVIINCIVVGLHAGDMTTAKMREYVHSLSRDADAASAVIGEGFLVRRSGEINVEQSFELLCRMLRRADFLGTVYEPPNYLKQSYDASAYPDTRITGKHGVITPDGDLSPSIPPTISAGLKRG